MDFGEEENVIEFDLLPLILLLCVPVIVRVVRFSRGSFGYGFPGDRFMTTMPSGWMLGGKHVIPQ